jgi:hypothetical protein
MEGDQSLHGKGQVDDDLAFAKAIPKSRNNSVLRYFEYPCVELAVEVPDVVSLLCAHAPRLKALVKTATIIIAFKNFNLYRPLSLQVAAAL